MTESIPDPTTVAITALNDEREKLRGEVSRLEKALVGAYTDIEVLKADRDATARGRDEAVCERDAARTEIEHAKKHGDTMFVAGYDQAVGEIRDHFKKASEVEVVAEIEKIWFKKGTP